MLYQFNPYILYFLFYIYFIYPFLSAEYFSLVILCKNIHFYENESVFFYFTKSYWGFFFLHFLPLRGFGSSFLLRL